MKKSILFFTCLLLGTWMGVSAQNRPVSGTILDEAGEAVIGATIVVTGYPSVGTASNADGAFSLQVPADAKTLTISYLGMVSQTVAVAPVMQVVMLQDAQNLEEVVVTVAYGQAKRRALTGSVASIDAVKMEQRPVSNIASVLEGALGVQVGSSYGQPGQDPSIRIRGFTTINGENSPLIVLDGVVYGGSLADLNMQDLESMTILKDAGSAALYGNRAANGVILLTTKKGKSEKPTIHLIMNQGVFGRGIPEYNRMGANDFMETMWLGYRNQLMTSNPTQYPTAAEAAIEANKSLVDGILVYNIYNKPSDQLFTPNGKLAAGAEIHPDIKEDLDWFAPLLRNGHRQEYVLSGDGRTGKSDYYFSANYINEKGYVVNSGWRRFAGFAKMNLTPNRWLKSGFTLRGSYQKSDWTNGVGSGDGSFTNVFMYARQIAPIYPIHEHDLTTGQYILKDGKRVYDGGSAARRPQYAGRHVIWENELNQDVQHRQTAEGTAYAEINFLNDFRFRVDGNLNVRAQEAENYYNAAIGDGAGNHGSAGLTNYRYNEYTFREYLYWNKRLNDHSLSLMAGHENWSWNRRYSYGKKANEIFAGPIDLINFTEISSLTGYLDRQRMESYLANARYNYKDKYYADLSFRRDGSARFSKIHRWGDFYAIGGGWVLSEENFMAGLKDKINFLKLRADYGEVGNDRSVGYYAAMALYAITQNGGNPALYKSQLEASNLVWEASVTGGVGIDARLFNRIELSAEYFDKRSRDLLFDVFLPLSAGSTTSSSATATLTMNLGTISNYGWEFGLSGDIIKTKNFRWNAGLNLTALKNTIRSLPEQNREKGIIDGTKKYMEGHDRYAFWIYQFAGVDQLSGRSLYKLNTDAFTLETPTEDEAKAGKIKLPDGAETVTINGSTYVYKTSYALRDWSGSAIPKLFGSLSTAVSYKDLALSAILTYSLGGKILDYNYQSYMSATANPSALHRNLLQSWNGAPEGMTETSPNRIDPNGIPEVNFSRSVDNNAISTRFLQNASYLVLKNINLSYTLPQAWTAKLDLANIRLNLTAENLFTLSSLRGMDPQQGWSGLQHNYLPTARVLSFGINVQF
jgi:TonB-linked SusC/RagA family outer membrane protein